MKKHIPRLHFPEDIELIILPTLTGLIFWIKNPSQFLQWANVIEISFNILKSLFTGIALQIPILLCLVSVKSFQTQLEKHSIENPVLKLSSRIAFITTLILWILWS